MADEDIAEGVSLRPITSAQVVQLLLGNTPGLGQIAVSMVLSAWKERVKDLAQDFRW